MLHLLAFLLFYFCPVHSSLNDIRQRERARERARDEEKCRLFCASSYACVCFYKCIQPDTVCLIWSDKCVTRSVRFVCRKLQHLSRIFHRFFLDRQFNSLPQSNYDFCFATSCDSFSHCNFVAHFADASHLWQFFLRINASISCESNAASSILNRIQNRNEPNNSIQICTLRVTSKGNKVKFGTILLHDGNSHETNRTHFVHIGDAIQFLCMFETEFCNNLCLRQSLHFYRMLNRESEREREGKR